VKLCDYCKKEVHDEAIKCKHCQSPILSLELKVENPEFLKKLRKLSLIEGCSTLILFFIAMPLKYLLELPEAVSWPGRIHGGLFILLVMFSVIAIRKVPIGIKLSFMLIIAAIIPFGPFWMDKKLKVLI
jgi:integral membrane protein